MSAMIGVGATFPPASPFPSCFLSLRGSNELTQLDPKYEEEVSGCTAAVSVISKHKIWVVCILAMANLETTLGLVHSLTGSRPMLVILALYWVSRVAQSLCHLTTSLRTKVHIPRISITDQF